MLLDKARTITGSVSLTEHAVRCCGLLIREKKLCKVA